ncbi:MAG: hypothetical protein M1828_003011 [Chrysothrix sp. TS-e1954]|nr:MAG: hypothetical protein M1828_003011 [Chrysothrix sp. TS-e1954]
MATFENLYEALKENARAEIFTCGGSIPIGTQERRGNADNTTFAPVSIYWESRSSQKVSKVILPAQDDNQQKAHAKLVEDCQPATFGKNGQDVLDESYRKALKLDTDCFSTTFEPYSCGITNVITRMLLGNSNHDLSTRRNVRTELYKLNIYSGPSSKFKSHVDTPRSDQQFGSLVVCLPSAHKGGELAVRHKGREIIFDWGGSKSCIQWAAFYSDCEHEVWEVTQGHRVTLTYNLYLEHGQPQSLLDVQQISLYQPVKAILDTPNFMQKGGLLGVECEHAYPQNDESQTQLLPSRLKGADMAIYEVFKSVGLKCALRPVLDDTEQREDMEECADYDSDIDVEEAMSAELDKETIGEKPICLKVTDVGYDGDTWEDILSEWQPHTRDEITWLKKGGVSELALVHIAYGNNVELGCKYSRLAIIVDIPPFPTRQDGPRHSE